MSRVARGRCAALCAVLGGVLALGDARPAAADPTVVDLDVPAASLPLELEPMRAGRGRDGRPCAFATMDVDGDGVAEFVYSDGGYLIGVEPGGGEFRNLWQINLATDRTLPNVPGRRLGVVLDRAGDGDPEFHLVTRDAAGGFHYEVLDTGAGVPVLDAPLPSGPDRNGDGRWDGNYVVVGALPPGPGGRSGLVVLTCIVGFDVEGRGVLAVDPRTGRIAWRVDIANSPDWETTRIADLDGDGAPEIVLFGGSADNLNGALHHGLSDDVARLWVLSAAGKVLWRQDVAGPLAASSLTVRDLDGDGVPEIVTAMRSAPPGQMCRLEVWSYPQRAIRHSLRRAGSFRGLAFLPGPRPGTTWIFTGSGAGEVDRILWADGELVPDRSVVCSPHWVSVLPALPDVPGVGPLIPVGVGVDRLALFDADLELAAVRESAGTKPVEAVAVWRQPGGGALLVVGSRRGWEALAIATRPVPPSALARRLLLTAAGLGLLGASHAWGYRRGRRADRAGGTAAAVPAADGAALRRVLRLAEDCVPTLFLRTTGGGSRLEWLRRAAENDPGSAAALAGRAVLLGEDFGQAARPRLAEILAAARAAAFRPDLVRDAAGALDAVDGALADLATLDPAAPGPALAAAEDALAGCEQAFGALRAAVTGRFTTDPRRVVDALLAAHEAEIRRAQITVRVEPPGAGPGPAVLIARGDLRFVLDNLLDNAVRALAGAARRDLSVAIEAEPGQITIRVRDTGRGIPPELRGRIADGRTSEKAAGGTGLHRSRQILAEWRGRLELEASAPGDGSTFAVVLPASEGAVAAGDRRAARG